ncbi:MAG: CarD family transcriptional regulator [Clostridium sp.]|uniref:CarD family transcriptional regulator n=1 Tax=Clostridium sp. TaxID=1506 RepID=UPI002A762A46|nr:CarD family transcriptional regulator [Clostridium sp.]MCI6693848.1 CarD family transcriptional regulator [Clostridium sp.]MDY2631444.1 CarD family transcriptional regulator [Clostridium sp.]MDY4252592.1 CarD family transcriptional regulator [Clostridium sp.]
MFKKGDLVIYSSHGICKIDDICEKTISNVTKKYYSLHPMDDRKLSISIPVDNDKVTIQELLTKEEAENIIESFKLEGYEWIAIDNERSTKYNEILKEGNRMEIAKIANTLMKKKVELDSNGKKFHEKDKKILLGIQNILFTELAFILNTTLEEIKDQINGYISNTKI